MFGVACLLLAPGAAVATGVGRRAPRKQLLRHPTLATEVALPLGGSRLLLGGTLRDGRSALIVLRRDGSLDPYFADHGVLRFAEDSGPLFDPEAFGSQVAVDQKGRILFVGRNQGPVRRLLPDGHLDRSFGSGGTARVRFREHHADLTSVAVQPDGKIVVGGGSENSEGSETPAVARLTERGNLDPSFGNNGSEVLSGSYREEVLRVVDVTVGPKGEVFAVSRGFPGDPTVQRLGPRGGVSRSFGRGGSLVVGEAGPGFSGLFAIPKIAVTPSGQLVVGSDVELRGGGEALVAFRYLADGRPDPSFGRNGHAVLATNVDAYAGAVAVRTDGGVVLSGDGIGNRGRYFLLAALRPDGRRDPTIGPGGFAKAKVGPDSYAPALVLQGKTAIAIGYTTRPHSEARRTLLARVRLSP